MYYKREAWGNRTVVIKRNVIINEEVLKLTGKGWYWLQGGDNTFTLQKLDGLTATCFTQLGIIVYTYVRGN